MKTELPTRADFGVCLDAIAAWENFGGKSLEAAYDLFLENPLHYQEDFMFMEERAFRFYYPVIDRYLRSGPPGPGDLLECGKILALDLQMHFDCREDMTGLHAPMLSLCDYVLAHLGHYATAADEQQDIAAHWTKLRQQVDDDSREIHQPQVDAARSSELAPD